MKLQSKLKYNLKYLHAPEGLFACLNTRVHLSSVCVECHREKRQVLMSRKVSWHPNRAFVCHWKPLLAGRACTQHPENICQCSDKIWWFDGETLKERPFFSQIKWSPRRCWKKDSRTLWTWMTVHIITRRGQLCVSLVPVFQNLDLNPLQEDNFKV